MPGSAWGSVTERTPAEKNVTDEEFLPVYHTGAQVAYNRGHADGRKAGHRVGWNDGVTLCLVNANELYRGEIERFEAVLQQHEGDQITIPRAFLENHVDVLKQRRRNNQDNIDRRGRA